MTKEEWSKGTQHDLVALGQLMFGLGGFGSFICERDQSKRRLLDLLGPGLVCGGDVDNLVGEMNAP